MADVSKVVVSAMTPSVPILRRRINFWLWVFIAGLAVSGLTAIPLTWEVGILTRLAGHHFGPLSDWIGRVGEALRLTDARYPFLAYGTDWLAFGHLMIAIVFVGPLLDPVRNRWALVFGPLRGIPFFWRLIDCSFGVFGFIPLWLVRRDIDRLERLT